ncbi:OmpA/MotB domain protein [Solidesulfovibrio fructosivorans JJ]]|uniref:OmpA/MotB domain protein n=1 Tax=Solidesulfovibrio fructosivorans JJ] TaxID=596151 RepID=E1K1H0_SOLFR|nr:OmpA family protein [Solidesulfovibrio fructosivorans]EFL49525.1 OmpA/MotB domain protein [Solidesulfovibrio fructosivorans JJ]]
MNIRKRPGVLNVSDLHKMRQDDEDLWPISLADMMTLLLCFFLLIVAVSHVDLNRYERVADSMQKAMVTEKPAPKPKKAEPKPVVKKTTPPKPQPKPVEQPAMVRSKVSHTTLTSEPVAPLAQEKPKPEPTPAKPAAPTEQPKPAESVKAETKAPAPESERTGPTRKSLEDIRKELTAKLGLDTSAVEIVPRENGVELNLRGAAFFDLASAEIKPAALPLLRDIAATLSGTPYKVTVEGHTDNLPIESWLYPSNWELSSARASRVARFLIDGGVPRNHLRVEGLADTQPVAPNDDEAGRPIPENQAKNRRVVILVSPS